MNSIFTSLFTPRPARQRSKPAVRSKSNRNTFCQLEVRRLLAAVDLRFATYNVLNFDASSGNRQDEMEIVFEELDADVLVVQEVIDVAGANLLLNALNVNGTEYARANFIDGPDTDRMLYYRTSKVSLISQDYISTSLRSIGEYELSVNGTAFNVYGVHLKASTGNSNEQQRLDEVTTLREHLETLPSDREFIVAGDMNIYTSSEPAYQKFIANESNNDGRLEDLLPSSQIGSWSSNSSFAAVHTQSPRTSQFGGGANGGLDDRFDMILTNTGLNDGLGLEYVTGSQYVPGNDGNHYNTSILTGSNSSASPAVIQALHDASDHLPVVAEFQVESPIGVTLTESGASTIVTEDGTTDSYEIVLDSAPSANVTIQIDPDGELDLGSGAGVAISLTFTPGNALTPQTVNVSAVDDSDVEGTHIGSITHTATSSDNDYDGISIAPLSVTIADNDGSTSSSVLLNEAFINNPGSDSNLEYVELLTDVGSTLSDVWLLEIDGDGGSAGTIDNAQNLSGIIAGGNGLILLGDGYETSHPWTSEVSASTTIANLDGGSIENGTVNLMLVSGFTGAVDSDLDSNNDGILDSTPWTAILDEFGWTDGGSSDHIYSSVVLTQNGGGASDAATRIFGDTQNNFAASWFNGDIASGVTYSGNVSSNLPTGAVLTPGNYNFGATSPVLDEIEINTGDDQRSSIDQLVLTFEGAVDIDSDAFSLVQRSNGNGVATGTTVASSFTTSTSAGNTIVSLTFDSLTRNGTEALVDGNYQLSVDGSKVRRSGTDLDLGSNFVFGDTAADNFFSFYGDVSGDRNVNIFDLLAFRQTYLSQTGDAEFDANFDHNGDGNINVFDLLNFRGNFGKSLAFV